MAGKLVLLRLSLAGNQEKSPKGGSVVAMDSVKKSNTVTRFKNNLWLTEQFTESQAGSCMPQ
jgi:hypothetical protein